MNSEPLTQKKKSSPSGNQLKSLLIILILFFLLALFLVRVLWSTPERSFEIEKKGDNELMIYGLEKKEIEEKIDWREKVHWTPGPGDRIQLYFKEKEGNWFYKLFKKPTLYYASSTLKEGSDLRDKEISFVNFPEIKGKKIRKTEHTFTRHNDMFREEGFTFMNFLWIIVMLFSILGGLFF